MPAVPTSTATVSTSTASASGNRLRAIAFGAGGFDTAMQLGVAHALLVARGVVPDYAAGISAGAINAAVLAEILQAGEGLNEPERRGAQVDTFRKFLASFQELPADLLRSIVPDAYEINASRPLAPIQLPIHFDAERDGRDAANHSRAGLIRVMNRLFDVRLPVSALAVIVNRALRLIATSEMVPGSKRAWERLCNQASLWFLGHRYMLALTPTFRPLVRAAMAGRPAEKRKSVGLPAGKLIGRGVILRRGWRRLLDLLSWIVLEAVWLFVVPLLALLAALARPLRRSNRRRRRWGQRLLDRILEHYEIADGLGNTYVLKQQLIRCFDPEYFGRPELDTILDKALAYSKAPAHATTPQKRLEWYSQGRLPIVVAPIAADVATGDLKVLPKDVPIVDALLAATAVVPIFPAVKIESSAYRSPQFFIDGRNVSAEPVGPLMDLLRDDERLDQAEAVDVYPVSNLALDVNGSAAAAECSGILDVAGRAFELQRFRDAKIEQRLTGLYSKVLPPGGGARVRVGGRTFVRAEVRALGPERPVAINREIANRYSNVDVKELIYEAVADGCRATLESIIPDAIAATGEPTSAGVGSSSACCTRAIQHRLRNLPGIDPRLPGHAKDGPGPGLEEVCRRCALSRPRAGDPPEPQRQRLKLWKNRQHWPVWPLEASPEPPPPPPPAAAVVAPPAPTIPPAPQAIEVPGWPHARAGVAGRSRPLVTLLFGGGVFRGVFHMGVMNALNELELQPDLVAGSSVGSIIAAMIAQAFNETPAQRPGQIANLAATFLAMDQLVMTDRLAEFVRGLTLRAADAPFSLRDLDLVLRRYDFDPTEVWSRRTRRVVGGLERLFYLSPVRLAALVKAARERDVARFASMIGEAVQDFLDRGGVGREVLGTEPLALLIHQLVIRRLGGGASDKLFDAFHGSGIHFLATATNLSRGLLQILGSGGAPPRVSLLYGLLASSAFPGVFRPRQSWEIFHSATDMDQYIDGGTMDNLPLDAVARFLDQASAGNLVARRPRVGGQDVPHLLFTASLEVDKTFLPAHDVETLRKSFLRLSSRARTFSYNRKIDAYATVQRNLREIHQGRVRNGEPASAWEPLDLHVVAVRPRWLCDTFGFHPMLGFRRQKQAESIAHGCASTLATLFAESRKAGGRAWTEAWGVKGLDDVDPRAVTSSTDSARPALNPQRQGKAPGQCWFRKAAGATCPFSCEALKLQKDLANREPLLEELPKIYQACGRPETHRAAHAVQRTVE
jgi:predicted acylesterase/phospholipase RssA